MRVLIACEESQVVCKAFRDKGHEAYSCDILPTSGFYPECHLKTDVLDIINDNWNLMIAFPPCTDICVSGARWFKEKQKDGRQQIGIDFFMAMINAPIEKIAVENPIGIMSTHFRKPDQIIQPWMFGHGEVKATCLWLKALPPLISTEIATGREARIHKMAPGENRSKERSKTYQGIADAMAAQWG